MKYGISGADVPGGFPFAKAINTVGAYVGVSPCLLGGISYEETFKVLSPDLARTYLSYDNGHGCCQLTSSWPENWRDVQTSFLYAADKFIIPAIELWNHDYGYTGDTLVRCVAATYNAGVNLAMKGHFESNVGKYTSQADGLQYDVRVLAAYKTLASGQLPPLP